jgi:hypothetical protein
MASEEFWISAISPTTWSMDASLLRDDNKKLTVLYFYWEYSLMSHSRNILTISLPHLLFHLLIIPSIGRSKDILGILKFWMAKTLYETGSTYAILLVAKASPLDLIHLKHNIPWPFPTEPIIFWLSCWFSINFSYFLGVDSKYWQHKTIDREVKISPELPLEWEYKFRGKWIKRE